jgi:hypothetical protein
VTALGPARRVLGLATFAAVSAAALGGCGGSAPSTDRAIAVAAGALGHGVVHAAYRCPDGAEACRDSVAIGLVVAGGLALVAGSMAWLDETPAPPVRAVDPLIEPEL